MNPSEEGPEVLLEVEVCILKGGGAGQGRGQRAAKVRGRNQLLSEVEEPPAAEVHDQEAESVSAEPVLLQERESSRDLPAGEFC